MDWLTDPFASAAMQRALVAGLFVAILCATVGTWMVLRGMAFLADALAHGALPGMAIAFLLDVSLVIGAAASALVMVGGIALVTRRTLLSNDTGIGLLFVGMLALGVVIISRSDTFPADLESLLFGDVLAIGTASLIFTMVAAVAICLACALFTRPFLSLVFDARKAETLGMRPRVAELALMLLIAFAVVASFRVVGALLVFAMLIAPPAAASLIARRLSALMALGAVFGCVAVVAGLVVSWHAELEAGATIALVAVVEFFVALAGREIAAAQARKNVRPSPA